MTIKDLSKKLHVSTATISRALNPATAQLVNPALRHRIATYAEKHRFVPNQAARNLVMGRSHTLGIILYSAFGSLFFSDYLSKIQWGISEALNEHHGYGSRIAILPRGKSLRDMDQEAIGNGVDGLLISTICDFTLERLQEVAYSMERRWNKPIVALNIGTLKNSQINTVSFSNRDAMYQGVLRLIQKGHEHIGLIHTDDGSTDVADRLEGFNAALADHRLSFHAGFASVGNFTPASGYQATIELFKRPKSQILTALVCTNDEMAFGAIQALKGLHKKVPQEIAVMGFDGLAMGEHLSPRLSTVAQPFFEMAKEGTHLLLNLIEGRVKGPVHLTIPSQLVPRDSD